MSEVQADRHKEMRRAKDADQAEYEAIIKGSVVADRGVYDDRVAGAMDDFEAKEADPNTGWQRTDLAVDAAVGQVQEEVERRIGMMGTLYPFTLEGGLLTYQAGRSGFYEFCLAASLSRNITSGQHTGLPRVFERVSALLVARAFGSDAKHLHLGSPRDQEIGTTFFLAMKTAHEHTREWFWGPDYGLPQERSHTGDEGVDFVVWKRPPDRRIGSLFVLGQCACGDDWGTKFNDIDLSRYKRWFNPLSYVEPIRAFSTPYHLGDGWLVEALPLAGLIYDRARLTILAEQFVEDTHYSSWRDQMATLTDLVISRAAA